jgi:hypothetical protein
MDLAYEAIWCIINLASAQTEVIEHLVQAGIIELLAVMVGSDYEDIQCQAAWALGNIGWYILTFSHISDLQEYRDRIIRVPGIVPLILDVCLRATTRSGKHVSIWCIANLCGWPGSSEQLQLAYPLLENIITTSIDLKLLSEAAGMFDFLYQGALSQLFRNQPHMNFFLSSVFIIKMVRLLQYVSTILSCYVGWSRQALPHLFCE